MPFFFCFFFFLIHSNRVSYATYGYLPLIVQPLCDLQDIMPRYWSPDASHPTLPREAEDFPRGGNHSKHMSLFTYLAWLQPIYYNSKLIFIRANAAKHKAPATLISSHKLNTKIIAPPPLKNAFQNIGTHQNCSLKNAFENIGAHQKCSSKKIHFKTSVIKKIFTNKNNFFTKFAKG